jgi:hypothetical protein
LESIIHKYWLPNTRQKQYETFLKCRELCLNNKHLESREAFKNFATIAWSLNRDGADRQITLEELLKKVDIYFDIRQQK